MLREHRRIQSGCSTRGHLRQTISMPSLRDDCTVPPNDTAHRIIVPSRICKLQTFRLPTTMGMPIGSVNRQKPFANERSVSESYSAASLWPSLAFSLWISSSAASEITVPGGKIASAPALYSAS